MTVPEPSVEDTISILRGLKERYEVFHGVKIHDRALIAAATLSNRYISDRFLPDKAIDLVDEACAMIKNRNEFHAYRDGRHTAQNHAAGDRGERLLRRRRIKYPPSISARSQSSFRAAGNLPRHAGKACKRKAGYRKRCSSCAGRSSR